MLQYLCFTQVVQQGQELAAAIAEASDVMAASGSDGSEAAPLDAQARVQLLLEFLHDRQLDLEELAEERRARFEQCVQLGENHLSSMFMKYSNDWVTRVIGG